MISFQDLHALVGHSLMIVGSKCSWEEESLSWKKYKLLCKALSLFSEASISQVCQSKEAFTMSVHRAAGSRASTSVTLESINETLMLQNKCSYSRASTCRSGLWYWSDGKSDQAAKIGLNFPTPWHWRCGFQTLTWATPSELLKCTWSSAVRLILFSMMYSHVWAVMREVYCGEEKNRRVCFRWDVMWNMRLIWHPETAQVSNSWGCSFFTKLKPKLSMDD